MTESGNEAVVELRDVTKTYQQGTVEVHALRGLTMEIGKGEFTAICGPSGSGKTTTLNVIGALDEPTAGTVAVEGHDLGSLSRKALSHLRRDRIGFVFQAYNLIPVLTAYENAEIVMSLQGRSEDERRDPGDHLRWVTETIGVRKKVLRKAELARVLAGTGFDPVTFLPQPEPWMAVQVVATRPARRP